MKYLVPLLILIGCGGNESFISFPEQTKTIPPIVGSYGPSPCFYNPEASNGFGYSIYTIIHTISFKSDNTGFNDLSLYDDIICTNEVSPVYINIKWAQFPNSSTYSIDQRQDGGGSFIADITIESNQITINQTENSLVVTIPRK